MKKYFLIFISQFNLSTKRYLENRVNTFASLFFSIIGLITTIVFINIMFSFMNEFNGWNKNEVFLLAGASKFTLMIFYIFVQRGITLLPFIVRDGELDGLLLKPISAQFLISFRYIRTFEIFSALSGLILFVYAFNNLGLSWNILDIILLVINLISGFMILYGIYFSLSCLGFWLGNFNSLGVLHHMMTAPLSYPTNIYGKTTSFLVTYIVPLGFIIMFPIQVFLEKQYWLTLAEVSLALILFSFSLWFWNFALKHYTSASS
jgi:ABC-2 type transport system permease protein